VPAAAVIPAPIGYIKVVAVKKLVVEFLLGSSAFRIRQQWRCLKSARHLVDVCSDGLLYCCGPTPLLRANWSAQSRLYGFEHISLE
jgi:hypothetical protein